MDGFIFLEKILWRGYVKHAVENSKIPISGIPESSQQLNSI